MKTYRADFIIPAIMAVVALFAVFFTISPVFAQTASPLSSPTPSPSPSATNTTGDQKTLVLLINYLDSGPDPLTPAQFQQRIFNGPFQKFYAEQSYGKISFSGNVYGWYTIPTTTPASIVDIFYDNDDISQIIKNNNINIGLYDRLVIVVNAPFELDLSTLGKSAQIINGISYNLSKGLIAVTTNNINSPDDLPGQVMPWSYFDNVLSHEMGHALGLPHAQGLNCGNTVFTTPCITMEYGNPFDVMGGQNAALHFNAYYKELLGWIAPASELVITKSGTYTINPLETPSGIKVAKIKLADGTAPFYLEYRRAIGFDSALNNYQVSSNQNGLLVNYIAFDNTVWSTTTAHLLNMSPSSSSSCAVGTSTSSMSSSALICWNSTVLNGASLNGMNTFSVPKDNLIIGPIIATTSNSITFDVTLASSTTSAVTPTKMSIPTTDVCPSGYTCTPIATTTPRTISSMSTFSPTPTPIYSLTPSPTFSSTPTPRPSPIQSSTPTPSPKVFPSPTSTPTPSPSSSPVVFIPSQDESATAIFSLWWNSVGKFFEGI